MSWDNLEADIAEEFSDTRRPGWVDSGFLVFRRSVRGPAVRAPKRERGYRSWEAAWRRGWRARRRFLALLEGRAPHKCQGYGCCNLLRSIRKPGGLQRFCSRLCSIRVVRVERTCSAPGCANTFTGNARKTVCSNACRQRAWQDKKRGGATCYRSGR